MNRKCSFLFPNLLFIDVKEQLASTLRHGKCRSGRLCASGMWYGLQHVRSACQLPAGSRTNTHAGARWAPGFIMHFYACVWMNIVLTLCVYFCSYGWGRFPGLNVGTLQADHEDRGPHGSLSGPDPKLPEGHPRGQHQLCGVRTHQDDVRSAVEMRLDEKGLNLRDLNLEVWTISFCECEGGGWRCWLHLVIYLVY